MPSTYAPGDASVAYSRQWFPFATPASLAAQQQSGIQILYENRYFTKELANKSINLWFSTPYLNVGAAFTHFGYSSYHEMMASLVVSRQLGERVRLGVEADYFTVYLSEQGRYRNTVTAQVGLQIQACRDFTIGFDVFNPTFSSVKCDVDSSTRLPVRFQLGFCYALGGVVDWHTQIEKSLTEPLMWATGFEYAPISVPGFVVRLGAKGSSFIQPMFGVGFVTGNFGFDVNAFYRTQLGFSLMADVRIMFNKKTTM
ncbi:MAG: hypothetical protein Q4D14_02210 [Bacteroidales bacterium]|nr:hypothetical protein [Bacteroidales bacterium]